MTTTLRFFKLNDRWYADVPGHTLEENGVDLGVSVLWICNVTHDVLGEHPEVIYINAISSLA